MKKKKIILMVVIAVAVIAIAVVSVLFATGTFDGLIAPFTI